MIVPSVSPSLPPVVSKDTLVFSFAHGQSALDADLLPLVDDFMKRAPERISVTTPPIPEADRIALLTLLSSETDGAVLIYGESGEPADGDFPVILKYIWESGK
ncbi:hypothetical protein FACS18949_05520 [Clostridia bacterium]|nr:hypothetical protein FACS18949_05520 [Clostridia bacterium]